MRNIKKWLEVGLIAVFLISSFVFFGNTTFAAPYDVTDFVTPTASSYPNGIVTGPDGNIWFTEYGGNNIAKLVISTGVITEFPVPTANSHADYINCRVRWKPMVHRKCW